MSYLDEDYLTENLMGYRDQPINYGKLKPTGQRTSPAEVDFLKSKLQAERYLRDKATSERNLALDKIQKDIKKTPVSYEKEGFAGGRADNAHNVLSLSTTHLLVIIFIMIFILLIMNVMTMRCLREVLTLLEKND